MWEWSRTVTERAVAASWGSWCKRESRPTILDPEPWAQAEVRPDEQARDEEGLVNAYCLAG